MAMKGNKGRLPLTRKEQIWYLLKNEVGLLFLINVTTFLFVIPLILVFFFGVSTFHHFNLDASSTSSDFFNIFLMYGLLTVPATLLLCIGYSGLYSTIKQLVFESTSHYSTYWKGIKRNIKPFFGYYLITGATSGLLVINFGYHIYMDGDIVFKSILLGANILILLTLLIAQPIVLFEGVTFNNYLIAHIRNGVYLFYKGFPLSLICLLLTLLPIVLILFIPINIFFIPIGMLATFYISLAGLINFIICLYTYEKVVDKEQISEIYHKGLEDINL